VLYFAASLSSFINPDFWQGCSLQHEAWALVTDAILWVLQVQRMIRLDAKGKWN
jgi:hypothetical protein